MSLALDFKPWDMIFVILWSNKQQVGVLYWFHILRKVEYAYIARCVRWKIANEFSVTFLLISEKRIILLLVLGRTQLSEQNNLWPVSLENA